jgi:Outer membrane protein beta-barrel domain
MKKLFVIAIVIVAFCATSFAQFTISRVKFGIQASPTFGWLNTSDNSIKGNGTNTGLKLGVTADYFFLENYAISTGLGFGFNQGGKLIHETGGNYLKKSTLSDTRLNQGKKPLSDKVNIRYHLQYLELPFSLKLRTQQFGYLRFIAEAPIITLGFLTQAKGDITDPDAGKYPNSPFLKENIKPDVNKLALSWGFGAGVQYDISPSTAAIAGIYYQKGFTDVTHDGTATKALSTADPNIFVDKPENSKGTLNNIVLRIGIIF